MHKPFRQSDTKILQLARRAGAVVAALVAAAVVGAPGAHAATTRADYLSVSPGIKPGPDGKLHDAYSQTTFHVRAGVAVRLVINNTDDVPHGIVSAAAGVKLVVKPGNHTYTLLVKKAGTYRWFCNQPCDPYSMSHMGYMMGEIIAR